VTAPLLPGGTLRARFEPRSGPDMFRQLGVGARSCDLGNEGLYLAEELVAAARWFGGHDPLVLGVLVLALMIAQRGSTCSADPSPRGRLRWSPDRPARRHDGEAPRSPRDRPAHHGRRSTRWSAPRPGPPLVVDAGCLYTERSRWLEDRVAPARRAARRAAPAPAARRLTRPTAAPLSDEQTAAVGLAIAGPLAVVTGGPGTGKTLVAAAIVRGLARLGITQIALAAQTGKAANRLTQVIGEQLAAIRDPSDVDRALAAAPPTAQTLHRLLGYRGERFAHHAQSPLPFGAVIVDEASMIDLEVMPTGAPLILIGDAHQLPAMARSADLAPRRPCRGSGAQASYRMNTADPPAASGLRRRAIHDGEAQRLVERGQPLAIARTPGGFAGVEWVDTTGARSAGLAPRSPKPVAPLTARRAPAPSACSIS
jgi:hypothetical protein